MIPLLALLLVLIAVLLVWIVLLHFGRRAAIEAATLDYRIAVEFAAQQASFRNAGAFIGKWVSNRERVADIYPEFETYRVSRVSRVMQEKAEAAA